MAETVRRWGRAGAAAGLIILAAWSVSSRPSSSRAAVSLSGTTMGTTYSIKLAELPAGVTAEAVRNEVERVLKDVNAKMSAFDPQSEISRWNAASAGTWQAISAETATVLREALRVCERSGGALDITVGPLVRLWHFGPGEGAGDDEMPTVPDEEAIRAARARVDWRRIELRERPRAVRRNIEGGAVDLAAVAKGYGVDRVAEGLETLGIGNYLVEIGGEVRAKGRRLDGTPWAVAVEAPRLDARQTQAVLHLAGAALATSGDYRNYFERDGQRFSHLIDPRTGRPIHHRLAPVSVLHPSCMTADAWATALMILGPEEAWTAAQREGLDILLIERKDSGFECRMTPGFAARMASPARRESVGVGPR